MFFQNENLSLGMYKARDAHEKLCIKIGENGEYLKSSSLSDSQQVCLNKLKRLLKINFHFHIAKRVFEF